MGTLTKKVEGDKFSISPFALNKINDNSAPRQNLLVNVKPKLGFFNPINFYTTYHLYMPNKTGFKTFGKFLILRFNKSSQ